MRARLPVEQWELRLGDLQGRGHSGGGGGGGGAVPAPDARVAAAAIEGAEEGAAPLDVDEVRTPGIWACGSWSPGIPLLEGCVTSSKLVVEALLREEAQAQTQVHAPAPTLAQAAQEHGQ